LKRTGFFILLPAAAVCLLFCSCFSRNEGGKLEVQETTLTENAVARSFSLHLCEPRLFVIYPSLDALSLNLISVEILSTPLRQNVKDTKYLDRISYSPDIGEDFGRHLFLAAEPFQHILYMDRESEGNAVLKWLSKTDTDETWWIDAFPGLSEPLAAVPEQGGGLQVVLSEGMSLSLYRFQPEGQPLRLATTTLPSGALHPVGRTHIVRQGDDWAFSVYDSHSKRLYLVQPRQGKLGTEAVYTCGAVHYSTVLDNRLYILVFEPAESSITMLERASIWSQSADQRTFAVVPVTLCEGTSSIFLTKYNGQHLFLFNERGIEQGKTNGYQLSLLYLETAGGKYEKLALVEGEESIQDFTALVAADTLYVLYMKTDKLTLLSVSLEKLARTF
jgi:hypothetical protein